MRKEVFDDKSVGIYRDDSPVCFLFQARRRLTNLIECLNCFVHILIDRDRKVNGDVD